ncbi:MAG: ribosome-associated translation inhibitor RaiA [Alphaproteobacteria bacterium]|nr:ribosome-associated translation inhibitor RaiA [Alphaproteobacteria bacterium]
MKVPLQITFRDFPPSQAIEARVREEADKLERFHPQIISCRVVLERPHRQHHKGNVFRTAVLITIPGADVEVTREHGTNHAHEDIYVSIRDAFDEARRRTSGEAPTTRLRRQFDRLGGKPGPRDSRLFARLCFNEALLFQLALLILLLVLEQRLPLALLPLRILPHRSRGRKPAGPGRDDGVPSKVQPLRDICP